MNMKIIKENLVADLRDFCKSAGFTDVVFGLSGGMDSALVLALAVDALGADHVHTFMMKTKNTSQLSIDLANQISKNFGNHHAVIDIQPLVDTAAQTLTFDPQNKTTMENIQARIRGLLCMTYSNEFNWLVLACGNKSESAMGYCTLYGDTCGAIMPLGDLYKTEVYALAELYPQIPRGIITRPASAELSPNQKDTDSLPDYAILDPILRHIATGVAVPDANTELVDNIRKRVRAGQFKRAQCPPILKLRNKIL